MRSVEPLRPPCRTTPLAALAAIASLTLATTPGLAAPPRVHAIVGARVVTAPGRVLERGTVVVRDGIITAVGTDVAVPADARVWRGDSLTVYAGMVDPFVPLSEEPSRPAATRATPAESGRGAAHELAVVHPETRVVETLALGDSQLESLRAAGFTVGQFVPRSGIFRGASAVVGLGHFDANASVLVPDAAQVVSLESSRDRYPGSLMGGIAVIRQGFLDAKWYREVWASYARSPVGKPRPEVNVAWAALRPVVDGERPVLFVADEMLEVLRASALAREAGLRGAIVGAGDEYKRVKDIAAAGMSLVVPVNFPETPDVVDDAAALEVATEELRHWNQAPGNAAALARAGVPFAFTAHGLKDVKTFRAAVTRAIRRGLTPDQALAAVTTAPAQLLGLSGRLGTLEPGKIANLTVTRGDLFSDQGQVREVWVDGTRYEVQKDDRPWAGSWRLSGAALRTLVVATDKDTSVRVVAGSDTTVARDVVIDGPRLRFTLPGAAPERWDVRVRYDLIAGTVGDREIHGSRVADGKKPEAGRDTLERVIPTPAVMGNTEPWRMPDAARPATVLVRGATIWTSGPQGVLEGADLLIRDGKIAAVGAHLAAPRNAVVVEGAGKHVAPGIIDAHSHSAILGNVNECTNSVTGEVRIGDVVNSESVNIYRQLAGGTTIMHLLHGSCNAIGGQAAVIKNKWGLPPDQLRWDAVPPTIKFALGENPKQANWGSESTQRYPQTRAGVEEVIRTAFAAARDYQRAWDEHRRGKRPYPPRRDLQQEAVLEILEGKRFIHSHSYRQDEILMLMRVAEEFGIQVQTFQHVLEGYKVADEMAVHGAGASSFSDWWAYKFEVYDAIPHNGYLMWDRGVTVSYNSDSDEMARRLNTEAAKAVKYGGVPEDEALKFVTLNPARQLRVADRVGSLEVGKDADFSIWNGSPLSPYSHCEQTWIEGRKYFDRGEDLAGREALARERAALIDLARRGASSGAGGGGERRAMPRYLDDTNRGGNECGGEDMPFVSEAEWNARRNAGGSR